MSLAAGTRIGYYEITAALGAGGMGEVYRARDTKLDRDVALKILPESFASDPDRLMRFEREAKTLASLNHSNIAAIYGIEGNALVMELVEGEDLSTRIARGLIPLAEALPIAKQIAEALEAAHEQGIIHRDLKPANIKVRADGTVKVLDFGLAKAMDSVPGGRDFSPADNLVNSPTITSPAMTMHGVILGTAAYMSPEQAKGKAVDKRADIWAFGCVLFEMLTGRTPFAGETITDIIAEIVKSEPDWQALNATTPPRIRTLLERCLTKDSRLRWRDIGDARLFLTEGAEPEIVVGPVRSSRLVMVLAAGLVVALVALAVTLSRGRELAEAAPVRLSIAFLDGSQPHKGQPLPSLALSPDGRTIVYTAAGGPEGAQLWLRHLDDYEPTPIAGTGASQATTGGNAPIPRQAFFSPDGKWIGFVAGNVIKKIPVTTGPATSLCEVFDGVRGATWTDTNEIVFATFGTGGLWRVSANGGTPVRVADGNFHYPDALPGGAAVIVTADNDTVEQSAGDLAVAAVQLSTGAVTKLFDGGTYARYVPTGHIVFARNGALVAAPFTAATLAVGETRTALVPDLFMDPAVSSSNYAVSATGTLVYAPGTADDFKRTIVTLNRDIATPLIKDRRYYADPRMSPQGRYLAVVERAWRDRIWVIDSARETLTRLTSGRGSAESGLVTRRTRDRI